MDYRLSVLPNGLRVITERMPGVRSIAVGIWLDTGSRDELASEAGCAHFLEHLLFKGSERLSSRDISMAFDEMGGSSNAFTSKEQTCFWARLRDEDLSRGLDILGEMVLRPAFRQAEIDSERGVVLEEINMNEDDPADVASECFVQALFGSHPLALPVLGTKASIGGMTRDDISGYWSRRYHAQAGVVSVAGAVDHDRLVEQCESLFGDWQPAPPVHQHSAPTVSSRVRVREKQTEQSHLVIGGEGLTRNDDRRFAFGLLDHVLGGGMSSRLFQTIREERGLAYAVYGFHYGHAESGIYGVYVGTTPSQTGEVLSLVNAELARVIEEGITASELERAKSYTKGSLVLSAEDPNGRMVRLGRDEITGMEHLSLDETLARFEAVNLDDVHAVAKEVLGGPRVLGAVGPFTEADLAEYVA